MGAAMAANPASSLPVQMGGWNEVRAAYRLLSKADVSHVELSQPHWQQTRTAAASRIGEVVLFINDTTELNYSDHPKTTGLGNTSHPKVDGLMLHSSLAVVPYPGNVEVLGLGWQAVWSRAMDETVHPFPSNEGHKWQTAVQEMGAVPPGAFWVSVADRESDVFRYFRTAIDLGWHCLSRLCQNRVIETANGERSRLKGYVRGLEAQTTKRLELRGRDGQPSRSVELQVSWAPITIHPPRSGPDRHLDPIRCWVIRCWEVGGERLEWILLTTVDPDEYSVLEQLEWYACRWVIEEYHKCLKTGCAIEARQLSTAAGLIRLMGFLGIVAVRLLQLRTLSRQEPEQLASTVVPGELIEILQVRLRRVSPEPMRLGEFWRLVARLGGFLGRKSDGQPGWQTLWKGWLKLQDLYWGVQFARGSG